MVSDLAKTADDIGSTVTSALYCLCRRGHGLNCILHGACHLRRLLPHRILRFCRIRLLTAHERIVPVKVARAPLADNAADRCCDSSDNWEPNCPEVCFRHTFWLLRMSTAAEAACLRASAAFTDAPAALLRAAGVEDCTTTSSACHSARPAVLCRHKQPPQFKLELTLEALQAADHDAILSQAHARVKPVRITAKDPEARIHRSLALGVCDSTLSIVDAGSDRISQLVTGIADGVLG